MSNKKIAIMIALFIGIYSYASNFLHERKSRHSVVIDNSFIVTLGSQDPNIPSYADFESRLLSAIAQEKKCNGISFFEYRLDESTKSPDVGASYYRLSFDSFTNTKTTQKWDLIDDELHQFSGDGSPTEIASSICSIVSGDGGKIN